MQHKLLQLSWQMPSEPSIAQSETSEAEALVARDSAQGEENAAEILGAVRDLGEAERQVLSDAASRVLTRVLAILAERAAPLAS